MLVGDVINMRFLWFMKKEPRVVMDIERGGG